MTLANPSLRTRLGVGLVVASLVPLIGAPTASAANTSPTAPQATATVYDWAGDTSGSTSVLSGVSCPSTTLCKAVVSNVSGTTLSWNGTSWSGEASGTGSQLTAVSCQSATLCKAVGAGGAIVSWNGSAWSVEASSTTNSLFGVSCPAATLCKAVGDVGKIVSWNGTGWSGDNQVTADGFQAVSCATATMCKAVGPGGFVVSWNGANWLAESSGTTTDLLGVSCPTTTFCKAVGYSGTITSWNGATWSVNTSGTASNLNDVSCLSTTQCRAVGDGGTVRFWNGTTWGGEASGATFILNGISCQSSFCKAVGFNGTIRSLVTQTLIDVDPGFAIDVVQAGCLTGVTVNQTNSNHPNAPAALQTGKFWTITPSPAGCASIFNASLTLPTSFAPNANSGVCRYTGTAMTWDCAQNGFTASSVTRSGITQFSDWAASTGAPTGVRVTRLAAKRRAGGIAVTWQSERDLEFAGFNLYRQHREKLVKLNRTLIPSVFGGPTGRHTYSWLDRVARRGAAYTYRLQAVGLEGTLAWLGTVIARQ